MIGLRKKVLKIFKLQGGICKVVAFMGLFTISSVFYIYNFCAAVMGFLGMVWILEGNFIEFIGNIWIECVFGHMFDSILVVLRAFPVGGTERIGLHILHYGIGERFEWTSYVTFLWLEAQTSVEY